MDIANSVGSISIAATTSNAAESATAPTNGLFTVTVNRNTGQNGAVGVNLAVAGAAVVGSRYEFINPLTSAVITPISGQIQVVVPSGQNTVTVGVRPINNFLADNNQIVQLSIIAGQSYLVGTPASAFVTVVDDEPTVSVSVSDPNAARPSTPGSFRFSYGGAALSQAVVVNFTYSGTGIIDQDFTAQTTVTIPSNNNSTELVINPIDTPDGAAATVTVTITPSTTYNVGTNTSTLTIAASNAPSKDKPTPGTINSGGSGGCGLGSGLSALIGLAALAMVALRARRPA
jgi:hypothetical protein